MWKKIAVAGGVCAAVVGVGTAALATSGTPSTSGSPATPKSQTSTSADGHQAGNAGKAGKAVRRALHAQWVTRAKGSTTSFVTHDTIRGTVTAVSPTSITVRSLDKKTEVYRVDSATKVRIRSNGKGTKGAISQVHTGDKALVVGTGTSALTARGIVDAGK